MKNSIKNDLKITVYPNRGVRFLDLRNAGLPVVTCSEIYIELPWGDNRAMGQAYCDLLHNMKSKSVGRLTLEQVEDFGQAINFAEMAEALLGCKIHIAQRDAKRIFPAHDLARIKPLKKLPKRWTVALVVRALVNGQFKDLTCNGKYTDDYHWDNATNFKRGDFSKHALGFAQKIYEDPSGWRASESYKGEGLVSICCHSFDLNEFKPVI